MPTVRYQIRNEYGLADPEVYRAAEKDDPEALLEGVAMAGLVGVLRQLGDLAEFAAEVFHDLHEEVMATSSRGHGLLLRVQQLDAEFPLIEKAILSQIDHSHSAYNAGIEWHPNLRVEQNLVIQGDMPRFILDSYEECRGPPQLFMLDKFDVAGAGACLTRYSNPSFFKTELAPSEIMESELQREKRPRKNKQKGSCWRNGETTNSFFMPIMDYSQFLASEPVPEKFPSRLVKLKHRNLRVSDIRNRKSYMDCFINEQLEQTDPKISLSGSNINKSINWASETREIITDGVIDSSPFREEVITQSPKEVTTKFQNEKRKGKIFLEKTSTFPGVSENLNPYSQNTKEEEMLMELSNEVDIHDFDISSDENDMNTPPLQLAERNNLLLDSGFISDVDHDSYASDDIGSELENYVDALNTLETEVETDSESRCKSDPSFFNRQSQGLNCNINGHLELQPQSSGSDFMGSFDTPVHSRKEKDVIPLRKSSNLVDFPYQLQLRTIFEETSSTELKINQGDTGKLEMDSECMEIVPSTCLSSNETCYQKQPNATMPVFVSRELERAVECMEIVPSASLSSNESFYQKQPNVTMLVSINRDEFSSSSISDSALKPNEDLKEAQLLVAHPVEDFSGSSKSTPQVTEQVESSFLPWKTNHTDVPSTFKPNATMFVPISRDAFSNSSTADSALKPNGDLKVAQSLCAHSVEDFSVISKSTPEFNEHVESSFLPGETNHVGVPSTFKEHPDELDDDNLLRCSEDRISATITDKDHMPYNSLKTDYIILLEKAFAECSIVSPLNMVDDDIGKPTQVHEPENKSDSIILKSHDTFIDMDVDMQSEYSAMKSTSDYLEAFDEDKISLSSNGLFPAETHVLSLRVSDDSGSHESTQTYEHVGDDVACIPDERGSFHERQKNPMIGHFSGYTENTMSNDTANTFQMPESPPKSSVVVVSTDYAKHNEIYSVKNLSPDSSALSFEIVSSNLQPESLAGEIGNIFVTQDEFVHPQSPVSSKNVDIFGFDVSTSPAISYELEQFPVSVQPHESVNLVILEPLLSGSGEDSYAAQLQLEETELIETNEKKHVNDELEFTNGFTKLDPLRELLVGESKMVNKSLDGNVIIEDGIDGQVHMIESAKVSSFDLLLIENPHLTDDALYQPRPDDEEPAITRVSKLFPSENKSYFTLIQKEEQDMFMSSLSNQTSVLDLSNSIDTSFTDINVDDPHVKLCYSLKGDNMCPSKNKQDSDSISENDITEGDTDGKVLPMLQSSNLNSLDVQFQEDPVSENATLNRHMPEIENLNIASHDSASKNGIAEDGTYHQSLSLLKSSYAHSFDAHIEEVSVSEDASMSQHKPDIEKTTITSDLTSLKFEREFFAPFSKNGDHEEPFSAVSSSQSLARYSSNITNATLSEHNFDDIILEFYPGEKGLICSSKNEQDSNLDALMQHFQSVPERPELQSEQASVSELSTILLHEKINMELPDIHLDEDCSDEHTLNHYSSEHEVLFTEPEIEVFINNRSNNELSMPPEKAHVTEKIEAYPSVPFQDVSEHPASSMISEDFASKSLVADFISPISITSTVEPLRALPGETISSLSLLKGIDETPPLPPLPPIQWRMGKPPPGNLISDVYAAQPVIETNPFIFPLNTHMYQHAGPFMFHTALEEKFQHVSPCTDAQLTESSNLSEFPQNKLDKIQQFEIHFPEIETVHSSGISSIISDKEEGNHAHGYFASVGEDPFTLEERRPKLAKLLPGLELERSQEASIVETDAIPSFNPFMFMPTTGDGMYQFDYGNYGGYKGENLQHHSLSGSLPVAAHGFPHYNYHMFLREGNSSTMYDIMLPKMEGENQNGKQWSIRNRQRDPLIEAVAAHDKSTLRKVSELDRPLTKSKEDEQNYLLEQIKHKSLLLKPATSTKANILKAPSTNLKVAAILQKANAIRQACAGSDEDDDDNWN